MVVKEYSLLVPVHKCIFGIFGNKNFTSSHHHSVYTLIHVGRLLDRPRNSKLLQKRRMPAKAHLFITRACISMPIFFGLPADTAIDRS